MNQEKKSRGWVKNAAIIFLSVMLVLTFFSNTILNWSLPEVSGQYAGYGTIMSSIRGTGTVTTNMGYSVRLDSTREIKTVEVKQGDRVEVGQLLFTLAEGASDELTAAIEQLETLEYNYKVKLLNLTSADYYESNQQIAKLRQQISDLESQRADITKIQNALNMAKDKVKQLQKEAASLQEQITAIDDKISEITAGEAGNSPETAALVNRLELLREQMKSAEKNLNAAKKTVEDITAQMPMTYAEAQAAYTAALEAYNNASESYAYAEADHRALTEKHKIYLARKQAYDDALAAWNTASSDANAAESELRTALGTLSSVETVTEEELSALKAKLDDKTTEAGYLTEAYNTAVANRTAYLAAKNEYLAAQDRLNATPSSDPNYDAIYRDYQNKLAAYSALEEVTNSDVETAKNRMETANSELTAQQSEYTAKVNERSALLASSAYQQAVAAVSEAQQKADTAEASLSAAEQTMNTTKDAMDAVEAVTDTQLNTSERELAAQAKELTKLQQTLKTAKSDYDTAAAYQTKLTAAQTRLTSVQQTYDSCSDAVQSAEEALQEVMSDKTKDLQKQRSALNASLKTLNTAITEAQETEASYTEQLTMTPAELEASIKDKTEQLDAAVAALTKQQESDNKQSELTQMELERDREEIQKQREAVEKLRGNGGASEVTAKYAGVVTAINYMAGDTVQQGDALATIDVEGKGYTLSFSVTNEQSRQIHVGDAATVSNNWWNNIEVVVSAIKTDQNNPGNSKIIECDVTGDVANGQTLTVSIGERQTGYDIVVPNSAIREDSNGKFVLIATGKSTPLGTRYIATRLDVTVLARDSVNTAIDTGSTYNYDFVITTTTAPIEAGQQVRLAGNS